MKVHRIHCQDPWFSYLRSGEKTVEGRKNLPKFQNFSVGDTLVFVLGNESFSSKIKALRRYESLEDYLKSEGVGKVLPGVSSLDEAVRIYLQWSTKEEIERHGFLAIEIELQKRVIV